MTKFILIVLFCSGIEGNSCKVIPTPVVEFDAYHKCITYGYSYSATILTDMSSDFVDSYRAFTAFDCKEESTI